MKALKLVAGVGGVLLLAGCPKREETVVVTPQPQTKIVEKTEIKPVPQNKTVIVKPATPPAPKTTTKTNVTVTVPNTGPTPTQTPQATLAPPPQSKSTPRATPKPKPKPTATPKPKPRPTATPRPKPTPAKTLSKTDAPVTVRAEIVAASKVPDPRKVAYKDSIVFFKYKVLDVKNGEYDEEEIYVAHWGMKNKVLQPASRYRVGQVQTIQVEPLEKHPELESLQRNDDTGEFGLDPYWAKSVG